MRTSEGLSAAPWRRQAPVWIGLAMIAAASWSYLARLEASMPMAMDGGMPMAMDDAPRSMMAMAGATPPDLAPAFLMWSAMMVAMMVPVAAPGVSLYLRLAERRWPARSPIVPAAFFLAGYIAVWLGYSVVAAAGQWALAHAALLTSPALESGSAALSAAILLTAGLFQFTRAKDSCLTKCRTPLAFFLAEWRDGAPGGFILGLRHGSYCVACCWALMAVLFVVGAMNLLAMAALTVFFLAEKLAPERWRLSRISGIALVLAAVWTGLGLPL